MKDEVPFMFRFLSAFMVDNDKIHDLWINLPLKEWLQKFSAIGLLNGW